MVVRELAESQGDEFASILDKLFETLSKWQIVREHGQDARDGAGRDTVAH